MSILLIDKNEYRQDQFEITKTDALGYGIEFKMGECSGVCGYNPSLDIYIGRFTNPDIPVVFGDVLHNRVHAVVHNPSKTLWWSIARNGCSSQLASIGIDQGGVFNNLGTPTGVWIPTAGQFTISNWHYAYEHDKYADFTNVVAYQDPVKRFIRFCNYAYTACKIGGYIKRSLLPRYFAALKNPSITIDHMLCVARCNAANKYSAYEQHYWPLRKHYENIPKIDTVVHLKDTDTYMEKVMHIKPVHANIEEEIVITEDMFTPAQLMIAEDIYGPCREIETKYADKFFDPSAYVDVPWHTEE